MAAEIAGASKQTWQVDTVDENENETAGRGMISNREIKEGDELFTLPLDLLLTKDAAKRVRHDINVAS